MALRATVHKARLKVSDTDRGLYAEHQLTIARHPSETDERMMVRIVAFALYASDALVFGRGLSDADDPDLVERDLTGRIVRWIEVGLPDERAILKASGRADQVVVVAYGHNVNRWWDGVRAGVARARNLTVLQLANDDTKALERLADRQMTIDATIQEGLLWFAVGAETTQLQPTVRQAPD